MTSGENFRKRREQERRAKSSFGRSEATRVRNPRILILTEGKKTEPLYLKRLCEYFGINGIFINVDNKGNPCHLGSSPKTLVNTAKKEARAREDDNKKLPYYWDEIYCVFDRDRHTKFEDAVNEIHQLQKNNDDRIIKSIISDICFEIWYLLHFTYTTRSFNMCNDVIHELKNIQMGDKKPFQNYKKGENHYFEFLKKNIQNAYDNAKKIIKNRQETNSGSYTHICFLLEKFYEKTTPHLKQELSLNIETNDNPLDRTRFTLDAKQ